jgi:Protein of unknown function (DUF4007)
MLPLPTHALNKAELRSLLWAIAQAPVGTPLGALTGQLGLSSAAVRNATQWAQATGLLDEQGLTPEGKLVVVKDPYLEATVTDWLMHFYLSSSDRNLWSYFVHEFLPEHSSFTLDELMESCTQRFVTETSVQIKKSIQLVLKTYIEEQAIATTKLVVQQKKNYLKGEPDFSNFYIVGYLLAKVWERNFKSRMAVLVDELLTETPSLFNILGVSPDQVRQELNDLARQRVIEQKSSKPYNLGRSRFEEEIEQNYQIIRLWDTPIDLLEQAYNNDAATPNQPLEKSLASIIDDSDNLPDLTQFLEWASELFVIEGGSNTAVRLVS